MAQAISGAPATSAMDVHVTGRRVLATIVDGNADGTALIRLTYNDAWEDIVTWVRAKDEQR
jgi:hypothetical protein